MRWSSSQVGFQSGGVPVRYVSVRYVSARYVSVRWGFSEVGFQSGGVSVRWSFREGSSSEVEFQWWHCHPVVTLPKS